MNRIICTEQFSTRLIIYDSEVTDWDQPSAQLWEFVPLYNSSVPDSKLRLFTAFSEVKPVFGGSHILSTASGGAVCLINVAENVTEFCEDAGGNVHSAEILPDGNIVSASSSGNYLTLFDRRRGTVSRFPSADAHGVVWDRKRECLWSSCLYGITRWEYDGTSLVCRETYEPYPGKKFGGHDLYPVCGSPDEFYLSGSATTVFHAEQKSFRFLDDRAPGLKSISRHPDGRVLVTMAKRHWWTDTVSLYEDGKAVPFRTMKNMWYYKARWMIDPAAAFQKG